MKIALIRPPKIAVNWMANKPMIGISYLCSYLISNGYKCKIFDANFNDWNEETLVKKVTEYQPQIIGITALTEEIIMADKIAVDLKKLNAPIILGGCHVTAIPMQTFLEFPNFDYGILGEGEKTLIKLLNCLQNKQFDELKNIKGFIYRKDNEIYLNNEKEILTSQELDQLPFPAYDQYYKADELAKKDEYYVMMTSRGCPYNCVFCMHALGRQVRRRSPENIVKEIRLAIEKYKAHTIYFYDEIFLFNDPQTYETLDLIIKTGLNKKFKFRALSRVNLVTDDLIKRAKEAGCITIELGIESGNDEILKNVNKNFTTAQAINAVNIIKKYGIEIEANYILGHPNETLETIKQTVDFAVKLNTKIANIGIMVPYPGTKVYDMAIRGQGGYKLLSRDWSNYAKYGGQSMELEKVSLKTLEKWQRLGLVYLMVKNKRYLELAKFIFKYKNTILKLLLGKK